MAGKVTAEEYAKAKAAVEKAYTKESIDSYTKSYNDAMAKGASANDAFSSSSGLLVKNSSTGSSGGTSGSTGGGTLSGGVSSGGVSGNAGGGDVYGDVSKNSTASGPMDFSSYKGPQTLAEADKIFGKEASNREAKQSGFISSRNDTIANELYNQKKFGIKDVEDYLNAIPTFQGADKLDQQNTIRAIHDRLSEIEKSNGGADMSSSNTGGFDWNKNNAELSDLDGDGAADRPGYYYENGKYYKILGYDAFSDAQKAQADLMSNPEKKELSNMSADAQQKALKAADDTLRAKEQLEEKKDLDKRQWDNSYEQSKIQMRQTLRHARESYDNLKQNWQYLGSMGMPGLSATKLEAIGDALGEAETTLGEIEKLENLKDEAMKLQWQQQALQYSQKIDDLWNNLKWQTSQEFVDVISKFTAAELEGNLDTIDGITAFRRSLLEDLDSQLSGITSASLSQMQYITKNYQELADKMEEYVKNENVVNKDMSAVRGYYIDGNGNPIFNAKGETIPIPQEAPLDPIYDKETGKLIVFGYDENGNIVGKVQDILNKGSSFYDYINNQWNANQVTQWQGDNYTAVTRDTAKNVVNGIQSSGIGGWCGAYVNQYLQKLGFGPSFIKDSLQSKLDIINTDEGYSPMKGDVVVFDYNHITPETGVNNGHVGIVVGFKGDKMIVADSNFDGDRKIQFREVSLDNKNIKGYFNPTKSIQEFNASKQQQYQNPGTQYPSALVSLFKKDKVLDSDYKWLEENGISRWAFEDMKQDYLNGQGESGGKQSGMGSSILDYIYVSNDNNATQNGNFGFASRAWRADEALRELEDNFYRGWNVDTWEWLKSEDHKLFDTYKEAFINAWLRKESGANITDAEFKKAEKFFPKAGDTKEVIAQKQKLREGIVENFFQTAGNASDGTQLIEIYRNNKDKKDADAVEEVEEETVQPGGHLS